MIKFFRHIRQRLLAENRFSKYLLYAIGEIVLVVIGILIALQINNWNANRKSQKELELITQNLRQEFQTNKKDLQKFIGNIKYTKNGGLEILSIIGGEYENIPEKELNTIIEKSFWFPTWRPNNYTLEELKNTGNLILIKNDSLKQLLFNWERQMELIKDENRRMEKSSQDIVDYVKAHGSIRNVNHHRISTERSKLKISNLPLFRDARFENQVNEKVLYALFMEHRLNETDDLIVHILEQLNKQ